MTDSHNELAQPALCIRRYLCKEVRPFTGNECPGYDIKQSDGETPVMLELWGIWNTFHCYRSQVNSDQDWKHLIASYLWVK